MLHTGQVIQHTFKLSQSFRRIDVFIDLLELAIFGQIFFDLGIIVKTLSKRIL